MILQLALDRLSREKCIHLIEETYNHIDWIEVGTSVIKEYGMAIVREISELFPEKTIVADMKICDAGGYEAEQAFKAGADITTVMAFASNLTIQDTQKVAKKHNKQMMIDLLEIQDSERMKELKAIDVELVSLHIGKDKQTEGVFDVNLFSLVEDFDFDVSVAGGISLASLKDVVAKKPEIIIVGSAITAADDPKEMSKQFKEIMGK